MQYCWNIFQLGFSMCNNSRNWLLLEKHVQQRTHAVVYQRTKSNLARRFSKLYLNWENKISRFFKKFTKRYISKQPQLADFNQTSQDSGSTGGRVRICP